MHQMRLFVDTHDQDDGTFPAGLTREQFIGFLARYEESCRQEGVTIVQINIGLDEGRAFCVTLAPDADSVRRAHERVGLPFRTITEVETVTPGTLFFHPRAA